jgi:hypothetical protein
MNSPAVTSLTLESAPQKLWHEWLSGYFDGAEHGIGGDGSGVFPSVSSDRIVFDQGALPQPLSGVGITVLAETIRSRMSLTVDGRHAIDDVEWTFYIRAQVSQAASGKGNAKYQARAAHDLLRALIEHDSCTVALAQKGITALRVRGSGAPQSTDFALRRLTVRGQLEYEIVN